MSTRVTDVKIYPLKNPKEGSTLRAFAKVILNEDFAITSIRVVDGQKGLFIGLPQNKDSQGEYHDICFPITKECRSMISDAVLEKYASNPDGDSSAGSQQTPANDDSDW